MSIFLILILALFASVAESVLISAWWPVASLVLFIAFVRELLISYPIPSQIIAATIFSKFIFIFSIIFIAMEYPIAELGGIVAHGSIYSFYYILITMLLLLSAVWSFQALRALLPIRAVPLWPVLRELQFAGILVVCLAACFVLLLAGVTSGFPLLHGVDRFLYRSGQGLAFQMAINLKPIVAGMIGYGYFRMGLSPFRKAILMASLCMLLLLSTLFGEKFASLIIVLMYFSIPYSAISTSRFRFKPAFLAVVALVMVTASSLTYFIYSDYGALDSYSTSKRLFGRATGTAQLWYVAMKDDPEILNFDQNQFDRLFKSLITTRTASSEMESGVGIFYLINRFAPPDVRDSIVKGQGFVQFTGGTEAYLMLVFGSIGMILIMATLGVFLGGLAYYVYNTVQSNAFVGYAGSLFLLVNMYALLNQAGFGQIFAIGSLKIAGLIFALDFFFRLILGGRQRKLRALEPDPKLS